MIYTNALPELEICHELPDDTEARLSIIELYDLAFREDDNSTDSEYNLSEKMLMCGEVVSAFIGEKAVANAVYIQCWPKVSVELIASHPNFQRLGIGKILMGEIEDFARGGHFNVVELRAKKRAEGFYQKLGYWNKSGKTYVKQIN